MIVESRVSLVKGCSGLWEVRSAQTLSEGPAAPVRGVVEPQS